jgi:primosomal protein N'
LNETTKRYSRKPRRCPSCGSEPIATISYGHPDMSETLMNKIDEGRIVLGGCVIAMDGTDPKWKCTNCETELFGKLEPLNDGVFA